MNSRKLIVLFSMGLCIAVASCQTIPKGVTAVAPFEQEKYLGKWYEIARLDFKWERDLNNVTATYSLKENGDIKVDNKGYNYKKDKWEQSIGKAKAVDDPKVGMLKVSFFGPFYSGYNVIAIDKEYKYSLVAGKNTDYLWILSRDKTIPEDVKQEYLAKAKSLGYNTEELVWVKHDKD